MLVVETIARIRREYFVKKKPIKEIVRDVKVSRNTVRKVIRSEKTAFSYDRQVQPMPKLGPWLEPLEEMLAANEGKGKRERLTLLRISENLEALGYEGGYDAVRRYAKAWRRRRSSLSAQAYVPLEFAPGEAYQFDWSHEYVVVAGVTTKVKAAHVRLCHSRMFLTRAYPRESQEMVFDAHDRAFRLFGGACRRGILQMCGHYLVEPVACTPGAGWEKGQVENQVGTVRRRLFTPRLRFASYEELNAWLLERCIADAKEHPHPVFRDRTIWQVFEEERRSLVDYRGPVDGFHAVPASVSKTCLVRFDNNKYSVAASAVGRPVEIHAYAERIVIRQDGEVVAEHGRRFGRGQTVYDPWHYVPVLARKPGALRTGAPFKNWVLPGALGRLRSRLAGHDDGDRQMVAILAAVPEDGLEAVEAACAEALAGGTFSADVVLNILNRQRRPAAPQTIPTPASLRLHHEPAADCARYDRLREAGHGTP
jgi:transposase